jgi:hypothetical protein
MGKYNNNYGPRNRPSANSKEPHSIWRGIGCLMALFIPAISIAISSQIIAYGLDNKWPIPKELRQPLKLPDFMYASQGLRTIFSPLLGIPDFYAKLLLSLLIMVVLSGLISMVYAFTFKLVGPSRYGPTDVPPIKAKINKKSR